jgi:aryl-alcohol dehydrogenase-like predicted oxidoreductase
MEKRALGSQGLVSSMQGLGCMGMSEFYGNHDEAEARATIERALDLGVTLFDTAEMYGPYTNEQLLGRALGARRDEAVIATKFGIQRTGDPKRPLALAADADTVRRSCDASLQRLGTDVIDLYYLHRVDPNTPIEETAGAMGDLVAAGKVRFIGLSEAGSETLRRAHATHPLTALQSEWSLWSRDIEDDIVATARALGIGIVAYSPLGRGFLTGAIKSPDDFAPDDYRRHSPRFQGENFTRNLDLVRRVEDIANEKGCMAGQLALAWVHARGADVFPIPGTSKRRNLEQNAAAAEMALGAEDLARIDEAAPHGVAAGERYADMRTIGR